MALTLKVTYDGGEVEEIRIKPRALIAAERHFGGKPQDVEGTVWAAWYQKGQPEGSFDSWLDGLDDARTVSGAPPVPLDETPSPEESPTSPSPPG